MASEPARRTTMPKKGRKPGGIITKLRRVHVLAHAETRFEPTDARHQLDCRHRKQGQAGLTDFPGREPEHEAGEDAPVDLRLAAGLDANHRSALLPGGILLFGLARPQEVPLSVPATEILTSLRADTYREVRADFGITTLGSH